MKNERRSDPDRVLKLEERLEKFVSDQNTKRRTSETTGYEVLVQTLKDEDFAPKDVDELGKALYDKADGTKRNLQSKIPKLNEKVLPFGIQIGRPTTYQFLLVEELENLDEDADH